MRKADLFHFSPCFSHDVETSITRPKNQISIFDVTHRYTRYAQYRWGVVLCWLVGRYNQIIP